MQESCTVRTAGNATAGRELSGLSPHRSSLFSDQTALGTNIRSHADQDQHWCRPPSAPMLNRFYLFFFLLSIYGVWWLGRVSASPQSIVRDFRPPISRL
jgi:hypothetical protein